jgi:hypothetical protein
MLRINIDKDDTFADLGRQVNMRLKLPHSVVWYGY